MSFVRPHVRNAAESVGRLTAHSALLRKMGHSQIADDIDDACILLVDEFARDAERLNAERKFRKRNRERTPMTEKINDSGS